MCPRQESFDGIMDKDDVSSVMTKVLGHLTRIAEHVRALQISNIHFLIIF
jgi:hypothetical protein